MSTRLYVPTIYDGIEDFPTLFELRTQAEACSGDVIFDFSKTTFLKHNAVALLGAIATLLQSQGYRVSFDWRSAQHQVLTNLQRNQFRSHFDDYNNHFIGTSIPYRHDLTKNRDEQCSFLLDYWLGRGWINLSDSLADYISGAVWESYENAFTHSGSPVGVFTCGQRYSNLKVLSISVIDVGHGISDTVQRFWGNRMRTIRLRSELQLALRVLSSSSEALRWAFIKGNSTRMLGTAVWDSML